MGKVLRVFNNDLYGKVDDRKVRVYAAFIHKKYMNRYGIFIFENQIDNKMLCYGSVHTKENSLVVFNVKEELSQVFVDFINQYTSGNLVDYELIDISELDKMEIVGYNKMNYDNFLLLENISFPKVENNDFVEDKKHNFTIKILVPFILIIMVFFGYYFYNSGSLEEKVLSCHRNSYSQKVNLEYKEDIRIVFDGKNRIKEYKVEEIYYFNNLESFNNFKNEGKHFLYFQDGSNEKKYEYKDSDLTLKVIYELESDLRDISKMRYDFEQINYTCDEEEHEG